METEHKQHLIEVRVVYPSAHHPAEGEFTPETTIRQIKQFAMDTFGLKEETVEGNQVVFFLYHDRKKIENLDQALSTFVDEHKKKVEFRLAKEIIAG
ncbi:MAG: hypothetical protein IMZ62_09490 [Chloroflexi bacterium]|jgi:hypothetical protein|nr:hypothetical protein [Chloroflexota bacterium]MBE3119403.1 hypothetical protein [Candidatus Atribacteria bacterium]